MYTWIVLNILLVRKWGNKMNYFIYSFKGTNITNPSIKKYKHYSYKEISFKTLAI